MHQVAVTIIGAGVVGLAIAFELSDMGKAQVVLLEKNEKFGQEVSSHNSEVVHCGIYYPTNSLKARLCVEGRRLLYSFCEKHAVPFRKLGKMIVASEAGEIPRLQSFLGQGLENGVEGLSLIDESQCQALEPHVKAQAAIFSGETGIIDSHVLMKRLYHLCRDRHVVTVFKACLSHLELAGNGYTVGVNGEDYRFKSRVIINASGLGSDAVLKMVGLDPHESGYKLVLVKGNYFAYHRPSPVSRLIYPLPHHDLKGLGVHATLDFGGRLRFGPDVEFVDSLDYDVSVHRKQDFFESAAKMIQGLEPEAFEPDMAGIRPKLAASGFRDFVIEHESGSGFPNFINLVGIESPGLTSALAIAKEVKKLVKQIEA